MNVLVVGGGIAGLSAARALTGRGIHVDLVEREATWRTSGAGITLYPNGERVLRRLGLDGDVTARAFELDTIRVLDAAGNLMADVPAERWPGIGSMFAIHRAVLHEVLVAGAAAANLRLGVMVRALEDDGRSVGVALSDGTTAAYDLVVGADGARSQIRARTFGEVTVRPLRQMYWRAAVDVPVVETATMVFSDERYVALMPMGEGRTYVALQRRSEPYVVAPEDRVASMRAGCEGLGGPVAAALEAIGPDGEVFVGPAEELVSDTWRSGRVVLLGDAAHTLSPVLAQGGSLAMEDAFVLAEELGRTDGAAHVDAAVDAFLARRVPRVMALRDLTASRIALLNAGATEVDLAEVTRATNAILRQEI